MEANLTKNPLKRYGLLNIFKNMPCKQYRVLAKNKKVSALLHLKKCKFHRIAPMKIEINGSK
jgi:hypothetical protein